MYTNEQIVKIIWNCPGELKKYNFEEICNLFQEYVKIPGYEYNIAFGTDSQMIGRKFQFISVVSIHRVGAGGLYFYNKDWVDRVKFPVENQKLRMFDEVGRSLALALFAREKYNIEPEIHIDASPPENTKEFTAKFSEQLRGYAQACGFKCHLKPGSVVASSIADRHTKKKTNKRKVRKQAEQLSVKT